MQLQEQYENRNVADQQDIFSWNLYSNELFELRSNSPTSRADSQIKNSCGMNPSIEERLALQRRAGKLYMKMKGYINIIPEGSISRSCGSHGASGRKDSDDCDSS
jgi:hypothetical protein